MIKSIKKRIEAVRRGEVPEGYIFENHQLRPEGWQYEKIGNFLVAYDEFSNDTGAYPLATSSRQGLMLQSEYYNDQRYEETTGGFHVVPEGYVTYRHMSDDDIFRFNVNRMGTPVLVSPEYPVLTTSDGLCQDTLQMRCSRQPRIPITQSPPTARNGCRGLFSENRHQHFVTISQIQKNKKGILVARKARSET